MTYEKETGVLGKAYHLTLIEDFEVSVAFLRRVENFGQTSIIAVIYPVMLEPQP